MDGHQGGRDAITLGRQLAAPGAKLTLAHVYGGHTIGGRASAWAIPLEREAGEQLLALAPGESELACEAELVLSESVGRGLHELADRLRAIWW